MKTLRKHFQISLAILFAGIAVAITIPVIHSAASPTTNVEANLFADSNVFTARTLTAPVAGEAVLTQFARQIRICPDFVGNMFPGEVLNVSLSLPPELNGTGACGAAKRRRNGPFGGILDLPDIPRPTSTVTPPRATRTPTPARARRGAPGGVMTSGTVGQPRDRRGRRKLAEGIDLPCDLLPTGCPDPLPGGTEGTNQTQLTITAINVKWHVFDYANRTKGRELVQDKDFASPGMALSTGFIMAPLHFTELKVNQNVPADPLLIAATVTIEADKSIINLPTQPPTKVASDPVEIPLPIALNALEVPKVFGLFLDTSYGGAAALYLPRNSTLNKTTLPGAVQKVAGIYNPLASKLNFVSWFAAYLAGLNQLQSAFSLPHWDLKELKDQESNLNDDDFIHRSPYSSVNDTEVEDEASSMLLIGVPNTSVQFFQNRDYGGMHFTAKTGTGMAVLIPDLRNMQTTPPGGVAETTFTSSKTPNNSLSSFKWQQ